MITIIHNKQKDLPLSLATIKKMVPSLLESLGMFTDEVSIYFLTKTEMGKVHASFFNDPSPTDCMSFPMDPPIPEKKNDIPHVLGEIFVCPQVAIEYAEINALDPHKETMLYIIHGLLHLLEYKDEDPSSRKIMRSMEQKCLKLVESFSLKPRKKILS